MSTSPISSYLQQLTETALSDLPIPAEPASLYEPYSYTIQTGGKRFRPYLALLANGVCGGDPKEAVAAGLAVEILHNFTLVHDDIMDEADLRRGKPSVYKKWDVNTAILSGDVMFADALQQLNTYGTSSAYTKDEYAALNKVFLKSVVTVCEGQALDMEFVKRSTISESDYLNMIQGKTAALLSGALEMGAITAHADGEQRLALAQFGIDLGIAFQIQDDLLDAIADPEKFGKRPGGDIHEGKKTYLTLLALERADEHQKQIIERTLNDASSTQDEVDQVLSIMDQLQVMDDIKDKVQHGYQKAAERIALFEESDYKQELEHLLTFLQHRDH